MGVVMMVGIVVSNSILIVDFAHRLRQRGHAVARSGRDRLPRPVAAGADDFAGDAHRPDSDGAELGTGSEAYAPLARAIIGGLLVSVVLTVYLVPAGYLWAHGRDEKRGQELPA